MKSKTLLSVVLLVSCSAALFAAVKNSAGVTFDKPLRVAAAELKPGDYKVEWEGAGPQVEVRFLQEGKVVATAPATLETNSSSYHSGVEFKAVSDHTNLLQKLYAGQMELTFQAGTTAAK